MEEQQKLMKILDKKKKSFSDLKSIIMNIRLNNFSFPDAVVEFGLQLIRNHKGKLGDECNI